MSLFSALLIVGGATYYFLVTMQQGAVEESMPDAKKSMPNIVPPHIETFRETEKLTAKGMVSKQASSQSAAARPASATGISKSNGEVKPGLLLGEIIAIEKLQSRGSTSGVAAVESYLSGARNGEQHAVMDLFTFRKFNFYPSLTAKEREELIPELAARELKDIKGVETAQLLEHRVFGANDELLRVRLMCSDGRIRDESFLMSRTADGWRRDMGVKAYMVTRRWW